MIDKDNLRKFYIESNEQLKKKLEALDFKLKYDYEDPETLNYFLRLSEIIVPRVELVERIEYRSFLECLKEMLNGIDNPIVKDYFLRMYSLTEFDSSPSVELNCSKSSIIKNGNNLSFKLALPEYPYDVNFLFSTITRGLAQFYMFYGNCRDYYEYSEVLPIFFEYLMLQTCDKENGEQDFIDYHLNALNDNLSDLNNDLFFAINDEYLKINRHFYSLCLADTMSYIESFEYVLNLIDRRNEDKEYVDFQVASVLARETSLQKVAQDLDIKVSKYQKIRKLTR